jgi:hypothetical protein
MTLARLKKTSIQIDVKDKKTSKIIIGSRLKNEKDMKKLGYLCII